MFGSYKGTIHKNSQHCIAKLFQIKCVEGYSQCGRVALRTKQGDHMHPHMLAPGTTGHEWIIAPEMSG